MNAHNRYIYIFWQRTYENIFLRDIKYLSIFYAKAIVYIFSITLKPKGSSDRISTH